MCCATPTGNAGSKWIRLVLASLFCGIWLVPAVFADENPPAPKADIPATPAGAVPQTVLEQDPVTGRYSVYLVQPDGQKKLLQEFAAPPHPTGRVQSPALQDYLKAIDSLAAGERYIIGVELVTIPAGLHPRLGIAEDCGLIVANVMPDKPAAQAGVQQHDILLKINGKPVSQPGDVVRMVSESKSQPVVLTLLRDAEPFEISVTPMEAKAADLPHRGPAPVEVNRPEALGGVIPPEMHVVGPGMILPTQPSIELGTLHIDLQTLQEQVKALADQVHELQEQLKEHK